MSDYIDDFDDWHDMTKSEIAVEKAIDALKEAIAQDIMTDDTVTAKLYNEMRTSFNLSIKSTEALQKDYDQLYERTKGTARHLARIRNKADTASGYKNESGGSDEATIKMRSAGAEGAVDRLITLYCGLLAKQKEKK